jgi:hypothetical protein
MEEDFAPFCIIDLPIKIPCILNKEGISGIFFYACAYCAVLYWFVPKIIAVYFSFSPINL